MSSQKDAFDALREMKEQQPDLSNDQIKKNIGVDIIKMYAEAIFGNLANQGGGGEQPTATDFAAKLLQAMIPSPKLLGNTISGLILDDKKVDNFTSQEELERATLSDRGALAQSAGKRSSTTAMKCQADGCNNYHFLPTGLCAVHSGLQKDVSNIFRISETSTRLEDYRPELNEGDHYTVLGQLRSEMLSVAQSFDEKSIASLQTEAASLLKGVRMDNVEKQQLLHQFKILDANNNGKIDAADLVRHISTFDDELFKGLSDPDKECKVVHWIKEINGDITTLTFEQYVTALINYRKLSDAEDAIVELNRFAFWDLRAVILSCPTTPKSGWLLKRGYYFSKEDLNPWSFRYFVADGPKLQYFTTAPGTTKDFEGKEAVHKLVKSLSLLECGIVDFSPKTIAPETQTKTMEEPIVFKVTSYSGKRITLASSRKDAIEWVAYLSWFANASKLAFQWKMNFGAIRKTSITLRDYIMLGSVVAKVLRRAEQLQKHPLSAQDPDFEKEFGITISDEYYIKLFGFTKENVTDAQGQIIAAVTGWKMFKGMASQMDDQYAQGMGKSIVGVITAAANTYIYAAATKNQINQNKYGVKWQSKSEISDCGICKLHFKTFSFRQTMSKHHCRCCGRVICFNCAPEKVELARTGKYERICVECIKSGGVPPEECLAKDEKSGLTNFFSKTAAAGLGAAAEEVFGEQPELEDNEDLEESDGEDGEDD